MKIYEHGRRLFAIGVLGALLAACGSTGVAQTPTQVTQPATAVPAPAQPTMAPQPTTAPAPEPTAAPTQAPQPTAAQPVPAPAFVAPSADTRAAADALLAKLKQANAGAAVVVGITGVDGDFASALALPFGEQVQQAYLKRAGDGWEVVFASAQASGEILQQAGVPATLTQSSDMSAIVDTWLAQLQDPRGTGVAGDVELEGISGDYARVSFRPVDPAVQEGFTAFLHRENGGWKQLIGGSAFDTESLEQLGIPQALWAGPEA